MKWESLEDTTSSPTSPRRLARDSRRVWRGYWQVFGLAGMAIRANGIPNDPSSRLRRKPVMFGCSFLLTAAGQFRICTGIPFARFPWKRYQQALHKIQRHSHPVNLNVVGVVGVAAK
jgi:hypothetical protein